MARASKGKDRHRMRREIRTAVVAQQVYKSSHRRKAHKKERGNRPQLPSLCLLTSQALGYLYTEYGQYKYSMCKSE